MRFAIVELSSDRVLETGRDFNRLRRKVEKAEPGRWFNPILIVVPEDVRFKHEEGEASTIGEYDTLVVAVPQSGFGYGSGYIPFVNRNRKWFGLSGTYIPSRDTYKALKDKEDIRATKGEAFRDVSEAMEGTSEEDRIKLLENIFESKEG